MATVRIVDAIIPEVYTSYTAVDTPELTAFYQSGVIVRDALLDEKANSGGLEVNIPFWNDIDPDDEPNYSTDDPAVLGVPDKIDSGVMSARTAQMNKSFQAADLVSELAGSNPMQRIRNRFGTYWTRHWQRRLVACCVGVAAANVANNSGDMVVNIAIEDGNAATSANVFSRAAFTNAAFTLGDHVDSIRAIAVHSMVYKRMTDNDDIEFIPDSAGKLTVPVYMGRPVIVDDSMPVAAGSTSGFKYTSVLFGTAAIGFGTGSPLVPVETDRISQGGNGGGVETLIERKTWLIHPGGHKWNEPISPSVLSGGQSPNLADLRTAARWTRVVPRKNLSLAFLITNG